MQKRFKGFLSENYLSKKLRNTTINAQDKFTVYDLIKLYITGITQGVFSLRAGAASWSLFLSLFPFLIFIFQVLPLLPHYEVIESLFYQDLLANMLPDRIQEEVINEVILLAKMNRGESMVNLDWKAWLILLFTIFISGNGISAIITGFNTTYHEGFSSRPFWQQRVVAFLLTLFFTALLVGVLFCLYYSNVMIRYMEESGTFRDQSIWLGIGLNLFVALLAFFIGLTALYYFGTKVKGGIGKVLPGALFTTFIFVFIFLGFNLYIDWFSNYNVLYGSIGTIMIIMLFIYVIVVLILIGFELNATLADIRRPKEISE